MSRSESHLVIDLGAHIIRKNIMNISSTKCAKLIAGDWLLGDNIIFFEPIPEKLSAIASGATPIGSAGRAPDKKKSTKGRRRNWSL
jgi:hypothetical protein